MQKEITEGFKLSPQQKHLWYLQQESPCAAYSVQASLLLEGALYTEVLREALASIVARYAILRTTFQHQHEDDAGSQVIAASAAPSLHLEDLSHLDTETQALMLESLLRESLRTSFDLSEAPLMHCSLVTFKPDLHRLIISLPALCADRASLMHLTRDIMEEYAAHLSQQESCAEPVQYADVSEILNDLLESTETEAGREYWQKTAASLPAPLSLAFEAATYDEQTFEPLIHNLSLKGQALEKLETVAGEHGVSKAVLLLSCWQALLHRLTAQPEIQVDVACDGRTLEMLYEVVGPLAKSLPLRAQLDADLRFRDLLARNQSSLRELVQWQEYFAWETTTETANDGDSMPSINFDFEYDECPETYHNAGLTVSLEHLYGCTDRYKIKLSCLAQADQLRLEFHYDSALYTAEIVEHLTGNFEALLSSALEHPLSAISALEILDQKERQQLLFELNETRAEYSTDICLHQIVEAQAERTPDAVAVVFEDRQLTYSELNVRANQLAHQLLEMGAGPDRLVGLCVERSLEMIVAILAIHKAGAAYLPLDASYPSQRLAFMLEQASVPFLLTQHRLLETLPAHQAQVICLDTDWPTWAKCSTLNPPATATLDNLAYVIYTSGSTGQPKGVMISHRSIINRILWMQQAFPLTDSDRLLQKTPFSFDASIWEIFLPLFCGAQLVIASPGVHQDSAALARAISQQEITVMQLVPSMLRVVLDEPAVALWQSLRLMFCGGEALSPELQQRFYDAVGAELVNLYGPTEVSIDATFNPCSPVDEEQAIIIGRPLSNMQVYVLDQELRAVPAGVAGELFVSGLGLARGYLGRPDLTAERFIPHPFSIEAGARLYRTGDRARHRLDGRIEYLGRADEQVKIRGFRIEPGEIETVLCEHEGVREAAVVVRLEAADDPRLVAYVVAKRNEAVDFKEAELYTLPNELLVDHLNKSETDWLYKEVFEDESYLRHGITLLDNDCIFDVGANIGLFTLFVHDRCRHARVYAFEPSPVTFAKLQNNAAIYGLQARLYECGLSNESKSAAYTFYPKVSASSGFYADERDEAAVTRAFMLNQDESVQAYADELLEGRFDSETFICELRTLSEIIAEEKIERIDLLKLDAEKSELDVLNGIAEADWTKIKQLVMEVHDVDGRLEKITEILSQRGYEVVVEQEQLLEETGLYNIYAIHPSRAERLAALTNAPEAKGGVLKRRMDTSSNGLRAHLREHVPEYMIPSSFIMLEELPRTPNGKVDRLALLNLEAVQAINSEETHVPPQTTVEEMIAGLWCEVLHLNEVSINDNFFELGGHSLLATQVISRLREAFGVEVALATLFEQPTVSGLAQEIEELLAGERAASAPTMLAVKREGRLPLSFAQQRLWFLDQLQPGSAAYNICAALRLRGALEVEALKSALQEVVRRHEVLRTSFATEDGAPVQVIHEQVELELEIEDLSHLLEGEREAEIEKRAVAAGQVAFDLSTGPLVRAKLLRVGADEHVLVWTMHHIVSDGWSMNVLVEEVAALYLAYSAGEPSPLPELALQYADYAVWQREWLQGETLERELDYWREQLKGAAEVLELPLDRPRPPVPSNRGATQAFTLDADARQALSRLSREESVTMFMTLLAAWQVLLSRYSGQEEIAVGTPIAGRNRSEIEPLIGCFLNTLVLRTNVNGNPTFRELLKRVREVTMGAYTHQDVPFEALVEALQPERKGAQTPLFQVWFVFSRASETTIELPGLTLSQLAREQGTTQFDLSLSMTEFREGLSGALTYSKDLFDRETISEMVRRFETLLQSVAVNPDCPLLDIPLDQADMLKFNYTEAGPQYIDQSEDQFLF